MKEKTPKSMHRQDLKKMIEENFPKLEKKACINTRSTDITYRMDLEKSFP